MSRNFRLLLRKFLRFRHKSVLYLEWKILDVYTKKGVVNMLFAKVKVSWLKSPSLDVVSQDVVVKVDNEVNVEATLDSGAESFVFTVSEKSAVEVSVKPYDGYFYGKANVISFVVPDLAMPVSVKMLGWEIVDVVDENGVSVKVVEVPVVEDTYVPGYTPEYTPEYTPVFGPVEEAPVVDITSEVVPDVVPVFGEGIVEVPAVEAIPEVAPVIEEIPAIEVAPEVVVAPIDEAVKVEATPIFDVVPTTVVEETIPAAEEAPKVEEVAPVAEPFQTDKVEESPMVESTTEEVTKVEEEKNEQV